MSLTHRYLRQWVKVTNNLQILPTRLHHPISLIKFEMTNNSPAASSFLISCVCESCGLRECLSLSYLYFCSELKHAITPGKKEQSASILKTHHKWSGLWKGLLATRRHAQMSDLGITIESEVGIWWIVVRPEIWVCFCLDMGWGGPEPWNKRKALLSDCSN